MQKINNIHYKNPYYIGYSILRECLKYKDIYSGISKSLDLAKLYLDSESVLLYKKGQDNKYHLFQNSHTNQINSKLIEEVLENNEKNVILETNSKQPEKIIIIPISEDERYKLVIVNNNQSNSNVMNFLSILGESFNIIIKRMEEYREIKKKAEYDSLTGLKSRESFNNDMDYLNSTRNIPVTFTIIDLFRLKYINDNINHFTGDIYIKKTAEILKRFFPRTIIKEGRKIETGDEVYRIGGDEFIIISKNKTENQVEAIMEYVLLNAEEMDLKINDDIIKGVNYGTVSRKCNETIEDLYKQADKKLSEDKQKTYIKYGLDRRS